MGLVRFLQLSDLHLGRPFGWLPAERREERRRDQRRVLERCVAEAIERGVHAILLPGDLFDQEGVDADTLAFAIGSAFAVRGCPPVFIAPGNHDPSTPTSHVWSARRLESRGLRWPEHVHVFGEPRWTSAALPGMEGVRLWGRCFIDHVVSLERPLSPAMLKPVAGDGRGIDVAVFHGSREGQCPPGQDVTAPFSDEEALRSPFAYLAVGHYHWSSRLTASEGPSAGVRLAYAGSAAGIDPGEIGAHGALEVRIEFGYRLPFVETEFVELDRRRVYDVPVDVTGSSSAERVDRRVQKALDDAGVTEQDIATVRLSGRLGRGVRWSAPPPEIAGRAFHLRIDLRQVRPDYDLESTRAAEPATTEDRFVRALLEQRDREKDPLMRSVIESALYYGLDAFRLREVVPAYEEIGE
jgi:DNA repair exonuclease SbcCD nuclease subunit